MEMIEDETWNDCDRLVSTLDVLGSPIASGSRGP